MRYYDAELGIMKLGYNSFYEIGDYKIVSFAYLNYWGEISMWLNVYYNKIDLRYKSKHRLILLGTVTKSLSSFLQDKKRGFKHSRDCALTFYKWRHPQFALNRYEVYFADYIYGQGVSNECYYDDLTDYCSGGEYFRSLDNFEDLREEYANKQSDDLIVFIKDNRGNIIDECYLSDITEV